MEKESCTFSKFLATEIHRIDVDKWIEGEKISADPGNLYCVNWVANNAEWFREAWKKSLCKDCSEWKKCGYEVKESCVNFRKDLS